MMKPKTHTWLICFGEESVGNRPMTVQRTELWAPLVRSYCSKLENVHRRPPASLNETLSKVKTLANPRLGYFSVLE